MGEKQQSTHLRLLFRAESYSACEFHCSGVPQVSDEEIADCPEIVIPQCGAYIRADRMGSVYLDQTTVGFFEAGRRYRIRHLEHRPDITTVMQLSNLEAIAAFFGMRSATGSIFGKSAVRATPEVLQLHNQMLHRIASDDSDELAAAEYGSPLITEAISLSRTSQDLTTKGLYNSPRARSAVVSVAEYVRANYRSSLTLDDIAAYSHYSVFHLSRLFKEHMKTSIFQYVKALRMESSYSEILNTKKAITSIALEHGFASHAHFTSQFSNWFGVSPISARKQHTK